VERRRRFVPELFRHGPGAVRVQHQESEPLRPQRTVNAQERRGSRTLEERARPGVHRTLHEIVFRCVTDIQVKRGIQADGLDEIGRAEVTPFAGLGGGRSRSEHGAENGKCRKAESH